MKAQNLQIKAQNLQMKAQMIQTKKILQHLKEMEVQNVNPIQSAIYTCVRKSYCK